MMKSKLSDNELQPSVKELDKLNTPDAHSNDPFQMFFAHANIGFMAYLCVNMKTDEYTVALDRESCKGLVIVSQTEEYDDLDNIPEYNIEKYDS